MYGVSAVKPPTHQGKIKNCGNKPKTTHHGHRPPALLKEQIGKYVWSPVEGVPDLWTLKQEIAARSVSAHDSAVFLVERQAASSA